MKTRLNKRYKKILSAVLTAIMLVNAGASAFAQSYYYNIEIEKYNYLKKLSIDKLRAEFNNISAVPNNEIWAYGKALTIFDIREQIKSRPWLIKNGLRKRGLS
ncbi:MAG: hypothetical protein LBG46_00380 [Elusimicrobiota bacterium]|jgi:hypothetical protein|nr:hypothetical protein [Elusimicrobiota bacterium]